MKYYFSLQIKIVSRHLKELGIPHFVFIPLFIVLFSLFSHLIITKIPFGEYIYVILGIYLHLILLGTKNHLHFLKMHFPHFQLLLIRTMENALFTIPFLIILMYSTNFLSAIILLVYSVVQPHLPLPSLSLNPMKHFLHKHDFEWIAALRNYYWLSILLVVIFIIGIVVNNYNLSLVSFILYGLTFTTPFINNVEKPLFVWMYSLSPIAFIKYKLKTLIKYSSILLVQCLILTLMFPEQFLISTYAYFVCLTTIASALFIKYAAYPKKFNMQVQQIIFISTAIASLFLPYLFPVLLILFIKHLFLSTQSIKHLLHADY